MAKKKRSNKLRIPKLRHCNNRGFVELGGKRHYLGPWDAPETREAYERKIARWLTDGRRIRPVSAQMTIVELCRDYWEWAKQYYRKPNGEPTSTLGIIRVAIRKLRTLYGHIPASEFGPSDLRTVRAQWLSENLTRKTINDYVSVVKSIFKWGVNYERISVDVHAALSTVEGLSRGRSEARENEPKRPVPEAHIEAVKPYVSRQVWAMIQIQMRNGARSGEIVGLKATDLRTEGDVWLAEIKDHKTRYKGKPRVLLFGAQAQEFLRPFMTERPLDKPLFSPLEAESERRDGAELSKQDPQSQLTNRRVRDAYDSNSYRRAITRACEKARIPAWTPHQLRHNASTRVRKDFGLDAAKSLLDHANIRVTEMYAEVSKELAIEAMRKIG